MTTNDDRKKESFISKIGQKTKNGIHTLGKANLKIADKIENKFGIRISTECNFQQLVGNAAD